MMRERGLAGASVNDVMGAAGLTRGGFYAHFPDKSEMLAEALDRAFAQAKEALVTSLDETGLAWIERAVGRYLSESHLDSPGTGCAAPALGADVARSEPVLRKAFQRGIDEMLKGIQEKLGPDASRAEAITLLSTFVGAMTLARAMHDRKAAREILTSTKETIRKRRR